MTVQAAVLAHDGTREWRAINRRTEPLQWRVLITVALRVRSRFLTV